MSSPQSRADVGLIGEQVVDALLDRGEIQPIEAIAFQGLALLMPLPAIIIIIARFGGSPRGVGMMMIPDHHEYLYAGVHR